MASELELARLVAGIRDDAEGKDLIAAQWKHAAGSEPLQAAIYLITLADPAEVAGFFLFATRVTP